MITVLTFLIMATLVVGQCFLVKRIERLEDNMNRIASGLDPVGNWPK